MRTLRWAIENATQSGESCKKRELWYKSCGTTLTQTTWYLRMYFGVNLCYSRLYVSILHQSTFLFHERSVEILLTLTITTSMFPYFWPVASASWARNCSEWLLLRIPPASSYGRSTSCHFDNHKKAHPVWPDTSKAFDWVWQDCPLSKFLFASLDRLSFRWWCLLNKETITFRVDQGVSLTP